MKKILIMASNYGSKAIVQKANEMGLYTIVVDNYSSEYSIAKQYASESWDYDIADVDYLALKCKEVGVDAVICGVSDFTMEYALELCKKLGLPIYFDNAAFGYTRNKRLFKQLCIESSVPVPHDYSKYVNDLEKIKMPVVVKATDQSSNRGMSYCFSKEDLSEAIKKAINTSLEGKCIIEQLVTGKEYFADYYVAEGKAALVNYCREYNQSGEPKNCYVICSTVADGFEEFKKQLDPQLKELIQKMGCKDGFIWFEFMRDEKNNWYVLESGYRMGGELTELYTDRLKKQDTIAWLIETSLGIMHSAEELPKEDNNSQPIGCSYLIWAKNSGTIKEVSGISDIEKEFCNEYFDLRLQNGKKIEKYMNLGQICFAARNVDELCEKIKFINKTLKIRCDNSSDSWIRYTDFSEIKNSYNMSIGRRL